MPDIKKAAHPSGATIVFDDGPHLYTVEETGQQFTSTTTFLSEFFPKFETEKVAARCAAKRGCDKDELIAQWEAEANRGRTEGTVVHLYAECRMAGFNLTPVAISPRVENLFKQVDEATTRLLKHYEFVAAEQIIASPDLGIAGMIDLVMRHKRDRYIAILDWKQNKEISTTNRWENGYPPIEHLEATDFNKYSLQLGVYKHICEREGYYKGEEIRTGLVHLKPDGIEFIKTAPYEKEVNSLFHFHAEI